MKQKYLVWRRIAWVAITGPLAIFSCFAQTGANYYRMKKVQLIDQYGFDRPMLAASMLLPADWQFKGQAIYGKDHGCSMVQTSFHATSGDGHVSMDLLPAYTWQWADDPGVLQSMRVTAQQGAQSGRTGCDIMPPMAAGDFLRRYVVPKVRPSARLVNIEPLPKVNQSLQQQARQGEAQSAQYGLKVRIRSDAARALVQYTLNGQPVEEWITSVTTVRATLGQVYNARTNGMGQAFTYSCTSTYMFVERAPQGQLASREKLFDLVVSTIQVDPTWQAKISGVEQNIQASGIREAAKRSEIIRRSGEETNAIITKGYEQRSATNDHTFNNMSQDTRGVETYRNPSTGETIDLSNQYGHAWVNNRGEYLLSDQEGFDPSVVLHEDWKALEHVKP
jgi:hypothetical protein